MMKFMWAAACMAAATTPTGASEMTTLEQRFVEPPNEFRPFQIVHDADWFTLDRKPPEAGTPEEQFQAGMDLLKEVGIGGVVMNANYRGGLDSEKNWNRFAEKVRQYIENGFGIWLYDERGYPSGKAGGETLEGNPEYAVLALVHRSRRVAGPASVEIPVPEEAVEVAAARAYRVENGHLALDDGVRLTIEPGSNVLRWDAPAGAWEVWLAFSRHFDGSASAIAGVGRSQSYINIMDRDAVAKFIRLTHQNYAEHLGGLLEHVEAIFTDEPALHTGMGHEMKQMPDVMLPWSRDFRNVFAEQKGYDIAAFAPALFLDLGPASMKYRYDFYDVVSKRVAETYFKQIGDWCAAHGVASSGHLFDEERLTQHVMRQGSFFAALREMQLPGIDMLTSSPERIMGSIGAPFYLAPLYAGSVADTYDRPGVMCEISALHEVLEGTNWRETGWAAAYFGKLRTLELDFIAPDSLMCGTACLHALGVTHMENYHHHLSAPTYRRYNDFSGRIAVLLRDTQPAARTAVLYPIAGVWANFLPMKAGLDPSQQNAAIQQTEVGTMALARGLLAAQTNFTFVDDERLGVCKPKAGKALIGRGQYEALVLPPMNFIAPETPAKVKALADAGMLVIAFPALPRYTLVDGAVVEVDWTCDSPIHVVEDAERVVRMLADRGFQEVNVAEPDADLLVAHRIRPEADVYFLVNTADEQRTHSIAFRHGAAPSVWDPYTGEITRTPSSLYETDAGSCTLTTTLPEYGSTFVVFER